MAITAETRNSIIELVVTAYNAPPGTALLTELVAIVDGGGTLADVATALTTSDTWSSLYPSFQTAEEFAAEWLGNLVPEASEDALAGGIEIAVGLINGGSSAADIIMVAQNFLANLAEDDAEFGSSAANFNNKVEVATYHTVTLELDADSVGELQEVLVGVTSDDDTVEDANTASADSVPGEVVTLTTGLDTGAAFTTGSTNDIFSAVDANDAEVDTLTTGDSLDGGLGTDTLSLAISGSAANSDSSVSTTNIENIKIYNNSNAGYSLDASLMVGVTDLFVNAGTSATTVDTAGIVNLHLLNTTQDATVDVATAKIAGTADASIILANGADDITATYNGLETVNLVATGAASEIEVVSADLETLNVSGDADIEVTVSFTGIDTDAKTAVVDASAATGDVTVDATAGVGGLLSVTMGSGDDEVAVAAISEDVTISGGEGTDTLSLTGVTVAYDKTAAAEGDDQAGVNVSGIESLTLTASSVDGRALTGNAESSITTLTAVTDATATYLPIASVTHVASGDVTLSDGEVTALTLTQYGLGAGVATGLDADEVESLTIYTSGLSSAFANSVTMDGEESAALTSVVAAGGNQLTIDIAGDALETVNAAAVTGTGTFTLTADGGADVTVTASSVRPLDAEAETANDITTGEGADSITAGSYNDIIDAAGGDNYVLAGAGDDAVEAGEGADTVMGGAGDDSISAGEGANVVTGEAGDDTITSGDDDDNLSGGDGDDSLTSTKGDDTIDGGDGDDTISAGRGDDLITGGEGDDLIFTGAGSDTVDAGGGADLISVTDIDSEDVIDGGAGVDAMVGNAAAIDAEAAYQANGVFVDTSGESAELNLPGIEALWLDYNNDDGEGSALDFSGADDLATLYLDINAATDTEGEESLSLTNLGASTLNLRVVDGQGAGTFSISGDGQDLTVNLIDGEDLGAELSFSDIDGLTIVASAPDAESGEQTDVDLNDINVEGASSITLSAPSIAKTAEGETAYETGDYLDTGDINYEGEALSSVVLSVGDNNGLSVEDLNLATGGEVEDGLSIGITVGDEAYFYVSDIEASEIDDVSMTLTVGMNADVEIEYIYGGDDFDLDVTIGSGSYVDFEDFVFDGTVNIDVDYGASVEINGDTNTGAGESFVLTLAGYGNLNGSGDIDLNGIEGGATSFTLNLSGWNELDQEGSGERDIIVTAEAAEIQNITIYGDAENHFAEVVDTEGESAFGAGEETSFKYYGEGNVNIVTGESDDTIYTDAGTDTIDAGAGNDTISAGAGSNEIYIEGGSDVENYDTIMNLNVDASEAETNDQDTIFLATLTGAGALAVQGDLGAGEEIDVAGAADADDSVDAGDVVATVTDGVMTLAADTEGEGTAEDLAAFDTLEEYIDAALLVLVDNDDASSTEAAGVDVDEYAVAFVFDGATYVVTALDDRSSAADAGVTLDDVVKLTGLSGEETLVDAGAADAILIG
jgi:Ca2+-binding RTX toxin-like protein